MAKTSAEESIKAAIRDVKDFPKPGIIFKDITPLLVDSHLLQETVSLMAATFKGKNISKVLGIESRGFIFGTLVARELNAGFVPVRKKGKLPYKTVSATYDLEYGQDTLQMHEDALKRGEKVIIVDDLLATGGTCAAVRKMAAEMGAEIAGAVFAIELEFLKGRQKLQDLPVHSLIKY
ncbi:MAG: adenine phosphoribosyltransferase [Elusimicrobia bacterium]|nr:adenine phosphoribosyltransferase [Elusimicrobiota bacterium]